jgi:membrane associated rhomboid family serine protease
MSITLIIIILTAIISYNAFSNHKLQNDLIFYPPAITQHNQWYRFISCGFIHADIQHLAFNMLSLYMFGELVEDKFESIFGPKARILYLALYFTALFISLLPTYLQHKDDYHYRSLGASGAVSAVVFAGIFLFPTLKIGIFILPPFIPGFIFAPIYLFISAYLSKKGADNINHSAHIWGSIFGVVFVIIAGFTLSDFNPLLSFMDEVKFWFHSFGL